MWDGQQAAHRPLPRLAADRVRLARQEVLAAEDFVLSFGSVLPEVRVTVEQWGDPSLAGERTVLIMPSFSHGPHVASSLSDPSPGWWEGMLGPGKAIDTKYVLEERGRDK
jgi:homoserine acetyltransferase